MHLRKDVKETQCFDPECEYNVPYLKPHRHIKNPNGGHVQFIIEKSKEKKDAWV